MSCCHICDKARTRHAQCLSIDSVVYITVEPIQPLYSAQQAMPGYRIPHEACLSSDELHAWNFIDVCTLRQGMLYGILSNTKTATCNISQVNADLLLLLNSWYTVSAQ
jgi:hypothetical protein